MDKLPFTVYDFFACLSSGLVTLVGIAAAFSDSNAWQQTPPTIVVLVLIVITYATGHVVANLSGYLYETVIVRGILGTPSDNLLAERPKEGLLVRLLPGYFRPLPAGLHERAADRARAAGVSTQGDDLFYIAFGEAKNDPQTYSRLATFLNLYGFCRNVSLASLIAGLCLLAGTLLGTAQTGQLIQPGWWAAGSIAIAIGLFYRYLKFFRQYAFEVISSYATSTD